ncbi:DUF2087 domain-containing protein [Streptomyces sp. TRM 70351]|uniref:DUF2087 domain-containing protein n=1 Tax=Streptomyces sp. TRM 70351 TaxID=3116552 RepID=UPI002E7ABEAE|nr:DUF2087 domain-containing protein [Streptomyces sp. TRM 70351]MEE1927826.1 DUF2087 domain-containing protein [Streptomyces sp. TRM 70351]
MTAQAVVGLLADPVRLRVFSAVVLGAGTMPEAAAAAGTGPQETAMAVQRLCGGDLIEESDGRLLPSFAHLKELVRRGAPRRDGADGHDTGDARLDALLNRFVKDGRLLRLPGQAGRRREVLRHLAVETFEPGRRYDEPAVNDALRIWADGSGTDHVALRRYLIELNVLARAAGEYWLREDLDEEPAR